MIFGLANPIDRAAGLIALGGPVVALLLVLSVIALAIVIYKMAQYVRRGTGTDRHVDEAVRLWRAGDRAAARSHLADRKTALAELVREAMGQAGSAKTFYERAALQPIAYYGQLARTKLGRSSLSLRSIPSLDATQQAAFDQRLYVRALKMLEAAAIRDLALPLYIDTANRLTDAAELEALGNVAAEQRNSRALVAIGKIAVQRGLPLDAHAYPTIGIPTYEASQAVPLVERAMVFAIARQESQFDPRAQSGVGARGLMQMMPATAQRTARRVRRAGAGTGGTMAA